MPETNEQAMQEIYMKFQMMDQKIKKIQQQLEAVTQNLVELTVTLNGLDDFSKSDLKKEILIPLNAGIYAKANLKSNSELLVNVGANVVVAKDVPSTKNLIHGQIEEVKKVQNELLMELERLTSQAANLEMQLQNMVGN